MFVFTWRNCWKCATFGECAQRQRWLPSWLFHPWKCTPPSNYSSDFKSGEGSGKDGVLKIIRGGPRKKDEWRNWEFWTNRNKIPSPSLWTMQWRSRQRAPVAEGGVWHSARFPFIPPAQVRGGPECDGPKVQVEETCNSHNGHIS